MKKGCYAGLLVLVIFAAACSSPPAEAPVSETPPAVDPGLEAAVPDTPPAERRAGPSRYFRDVMRELVGEGYSLIDMKPVGESARQLSSEPGFEALAGVTEEFRLHFGRDAAVFIDGERYFPDVIVEEWWCPDEGSAAAIVAALDEAMLTDELRYTQFKNPTRWWAAGDKVYYIHTRAEMFRGELATVERLMKGLRP